MILNYKNVYTNFLFFFRLELDLVMKIYRNIQNFSKNMLLNNLKVIIVMTKAMNQITGLKRFRCGK